MNESFTASTSVDDTTLLVTDKRIHKIRGTNEEGQNGVQVGKVRVTCSVSVLLSD